MTFLMLTVSPSGSSRLTTFTEFWPVVTTFPSKICNTDGSIVAEYLNVMISPACIDGIVYVKLFPLTDLSPDTDEDLFDVSTKEFGSKDKPSPVIVSVTTTLVLLPDD